MIEKIVSKLVSSNVFVVSKGGQCVIVDAGAKLKDVKAVVGDKKVVGVLLTHGHYDHCFYVTEYAKHFGCKIYCSQYAKEYLQNADYNYSDGHFVCQDFSDFEFLSGHGQLQLADITVYFKQLGGHSLSDMCFQIDDDLFVGDVLIGRDIGRLDLYGGNKLDMAESLTTLLETNYKTMHSGHGESNSKKVQDTVATVWLKYLKR